MLNFENCVLNKVVIHRVGNKYAGEQLELSRECFLSDDEDTVKILKEYFLSSFKREAFYHFMPYEDELLNNPTYSAVSGVFDEHTAFYSESVKIAEHLFEQSNRPDVKPGELYMVHFSDVNTDEGACDAIGIFKSENKDTFLKIYQSQDS
ncbi:nucleoid-associated protein, partial [Odoribacter sp. OttesenSCG-928-J03]|nr:nucleoid-associated protein [Odoribacter sp. OttesenSCG-928-J03]